MLKQLHQTLREIGIGPQKIDLFRRMAMLLRASNRSALRGLVPSLKAATQDLAPCNGSGIDQTQPSSQSASQNSIRGLVQLHGLISALAQIDIPTESTGNEAVSVQSWSPETQAGSSGQLSDGDSADGSPSPSAFERRRWALIIPPPKPPLKAR